MISAGLLIESTQTWQVGSGGALRITGFNPDPSICPVGDDYYLATSTFPVSRRLLSCLR
jgi:hypothetical protein